MVDFLFRDTVPPLDTSINVYKQTYPQHENPAKSHRNGNIDISLHYRDSLPSFHVAAELCKGIQQDLPTGIKATHTMKPDLTLVPFHKPQHRRESQQTLSWSSVSAARVLVQ
ncbi:conserved hypothetical protein, unlikely [Trypanosoma brucei gambiense DAL972]|nr:conserved hypothetical protein, unlikely [Trypanosoma brucei gambiense DAL972]CBH16317.1 conserved hypothetical protein, unlikely [Trypanosoma brucei gambiense DAL972]|eukprot:XP_011778581.1 conserved hypothetical protein, unlikely [Trypanosoma brucei gambiense DAL972]